MASYLHLLYHLLAERADLGGAGDYHVLRTLVLAGDPIEGAAFILNVGVEVCLEGDMGRPRSIQISQQGPTGGRAKETSGATVQGLRPGSNRRA